MLIGTLKFYSAQSPGGHLSLWIALPDGALYRASKSNCKRWDAGLPWGLRSAVSSSRGLLQRARRHLQLNFCSKDPQTRNTKRRAGNLGWRLSMQQELGVRWQGSKQGHSILLSSRRGGGRVARGKGGSLGTSQHELARLLLREWADLPRLLCSCTAYALVHAQHSVGHTHSVGSAVDYAGADTMSSASVAC